MAMIESRRQKASRWTITVLLTLLLVFMLLPLIYLVSQSLKPMDELFIFPPTFYPKRPTLNNFSTLMTALSSIDVPFPRYVFNSLFVTVCGVGCSVVVCSVGAYGLSKYQFRGNSLMFNIVVATLMFPAVAAGLPNYIIISTLGLTNNYLALILPAIGSSFTLFLLKQFIDQIPDTYLEAARLDGAGEMKIFLTVILPLIKPAISTAIVFAFIAMWNDSYAPMLYLNEEQLKTLPLVITSIGTTVSRAGAQAAASILMLLPTVILFAIMQKRVLNTMMYSGLKG